MLAHNEERRTAVLCDGGQRLNSWLDHDGPLRKSHCALYYEGNSNSQSNAGKAIKTVQHVRREEDHVTKTVMSMEITGKKPRGRPKMRWMDRVKSDLEEFEIAAEVALNRNKWR